MARSPHLEWTVCWVGTLGMSCMSYASAPGANDPQAVSNLVTGLATQTAFTMFN